MYAKIKGFNIFFYNFTILQRSVDRPVIKNCCCRLFKKLLRCYFTSTVVVYCSILNYYPNPTKLLRIQLIMYIMEIND